MTPANATYQLQIYRNLDNRAQGLADDGPYALKLHERRAAALHDVFDNSQGAVDVIDWGLTDDKASHELIFMLVSAVAVPVLSGAASPVLTAIGKFIGNKIADTAASRSFDWIIAKLLPKQQAGEIADYTVKGPDGTTVQVAVPQGTQVSVRIWDASGSFSETTIAADKP